MEFSHVEGSNIYQTSTEAADGDTNEVVVSQANDLTDAHRRQTNLSDVNRYDPRNPRTLATKSLTKERIQAVMNEGLSKATAAERLGGAVSTLGRYMDKYGLGAWNKSKRKSLKRSPRFVLGTSPSGSNSGMPGGSSENSLLSANHGEVAAVPQELWAHFPPLQPLHIPSSNDGIISVAMKKSLLCEPVKKGHISQPTPMNYVEALPQSISQQDVQIRTTFHSPAMCLEKESFEMMQQVGDGFSQQHQQQLLPTDDNAQVQAPVPALPGSSAMNYAQVQAPASFAPAEAVSYSDERLPQQQFSPLYPSEDNSSDIYLHLDQFGDINILTHLN